MNLRIIFAIFKKQLKDTIKNKTVFIQFILFPIMSLVLSQAMSSVEDMPSTYFIVMFSTMYVAFIPMLCSATIISEEKEKNTLRVLMMSNVKPSEYLIGIGLYIFTFTTIGSIFMGLIGKYQGMELVKFIAILMMGTLCSQLLGSALGIVSKNQMSANSLTTPFAIILSFCPMLAMFNEKIEIFSKFMFSQQINYLIDDLSASNMTWDRFAIIAANFAIFIGIFIYTYRKGKLAD